MTIFYPQRVCARTGLLCVQDSELLPKECVRRKGAERLFFCLLRSASQNEMVRFYEADSENMASHAGFHVRTHCTDSQVDGHFHKLPMFSEENSLVK